MKLHGGRLDLRFIPRRRFVTEAARACRLGLSRRGKRHEGYARRGRSSVGRTRRAGRRTRGGHRAGADRSAELVLAGRVDLERLQAAARAGLRGSEHRADGQEVEGRARRHRLPGQDLHDLPAAGRHGLRHSDRRGQQHPARPGARVLSRPPQHAVGRQPLPDHEPVLDGGLLRQLRRPTRRVRAVQAPLPLVPVLHDGVRRGGPGGALPGRRQLPLQPELPHRRARRLAGGRRRRQDRRVRQHLLRRRRAGRVRAPGRSSAR